MRGMNLPPLPKPPSNLEECWNLYVSRLERGRMPFPEASQLLTAYMAWPNDEAERDRWMATAIAFFVAQQAENGPRLESPTDVTFELFGGLRAVADSSLSSLMDKLGAIQARWLRVADVLQMIVDISRGECCPKGGKASHGHPALRGRPFAWSVRDLARARSDTRAGGHP
jgi:hypothetical protein